MTYVDVMRCLYVILLLVLCVYVCAAPESLRSTGGRVRWGVFLLLAFVALDVLRRSWNEILLP